MIKKFLNIIGYAAGLTLGFIGLAAFFAFLVFDSLVVSIQIMWRKIPK